MEIVASKQNHSWIYSIEHLLQWKIPSNYANYGNGSFD